MAVFNDAAKTVFDAAESGNAVLLNEVLQQMDPTERASALETKTSSVFKSFGRRACHGLYSPLAIAAAKGRNIDVLTCLLENGADVNACVDRNCTPLMLASNYGHVNVVTLLVKHGANVGLQDKDGNTAIHYAINHENFDSCEVLHCLIENGADVNACTNDNLAPLMQACRFRLKNVVTFLIKHGANIGLQDKDGNTAFHYAIDGNWDLCNVLSCLIENGADVNACTNNNFTPLMKASKCGLENVVTFLLKHGANMDLQDRNGDTALHYAVCGNSTDVIHKLLTLGAAQLYNNQHLTPLLLASNLLQISMVEELINRPECIKEQRIDALELLGASATSYGDYETAYEYMKRGLEERFQDPLNPLLKQPMEPIGAYQYRKESQTLEEFARIETKMISIAMEGLVIRERILGHDNMELLGPIHNLAEELQCRCSRVNYDISIGLRRHAIKIAQHCNQSIINALGCLTNELCEMVQNNFAPSQKLILEVLEQAILECKKEREKLMSGNFEGEPLREPLLNGLLDSILYLLQFFAKDLLYEDVFEGDMNLSRSVLLQKLCSLNPQDYHGNTLLHLAAAGRFPVKGSIVTRLFGFPCVKTVKLLLNAGVKVDAINNKGDTALHRAATFNPRHWENYHLITDMLQVLLDGGAHPDFVNNDGKTAMDVAINVRAFNFLSDKKGLDLKCISARAVKKFGLPYLGVVPKTLEKYVNRH